MRGGGAPEVGRWDDSHSFDTSFCVVFINSVLGPACFGLINSSGCAQCTLHMCLQMHAASPVFVTTVQYPHPFCVEFPSPILGVYPCGVDTGQIHTRD